MKDKVLTAERYALVDRERMKAALRRAVKSGRRLVDMHKFALRLPPRGMA